MCGRYVSATPPDEVAKYFGALAPAPEHALSPNHNVAPTQTVYAVREREGVRSLDTLHWGLVPFWAKDPKIGNRMINARAETVAQKNAFRVPFSRRRCIIPADGFYEWQRLEGSKRKQPMFISRPDGEPFAFAGLWERWRDDNSLDADGEPLELRSCTIITCEANDAMAEIHDRMPVVLPPGAWDLWLEPSNADAEAAAALLVPAPSSLIRMHPVSTEVNNARNNGSHLIERADPIEA
ncbi:MAG: SOS response-associated peptidase [Acidimicrobiaceae bacterium]|nr:SOS response-associated peptidase [Acidimicrobiaceae bacterium]MYG99234.1 SOS response-associated peptidase [Acidimicrobiaceae bacterium]MYL04349.1 SOS response-associated peptidase [Acidimicrobiaceae bacterium]